MPSPDAVENYTGFSDIAGFDLIQHFYSHAKLFGADFVRQALVGIRKNYDGFTLECSDSEVKTKSVILCMGATHKKLGIDGENKFEGRGVSYCAVCDGYFFKDKTVAVIGGGNTAVTRGNLSFSYMQTGFSYLQGRRIESRQSACAKA